MYFLKLKSRAVRSHVRHNKIQFCYSETGNKYNRRLDRVSRIAIYQLSHTSVDSYDIRVVARCQHSEQWIWLKGPRIGIHRVLIMYSDCAEGRSQYINKPSAIRAHSIQAPAADNVRRQYNAFARPRCSTSNDFVDVRITLTEIRCVCV